MSHFLRSSNTVSATHLSLFDLGNGRTAFFRHATVDPSTVNIGHVASRVRAIEQYKLAPCYRCENDGLACEAHLPGTQCECCETRGFYCSHLSRGGYLREMQALYIFLVTQAEPPDRVVVAQELDIALLTVYQNFDIRRSTSEHHRFRSFLGLLARASSPAAVRRLRQTWGSYRCSPRVLELADTRLLALLRDSPEL
ncbi:hypothetical protein MKEN_00208300 [Mycena kentingensis (nom. inval.)]|nr:hypothetical protein MKEN_00208300 [Mycena kentingensis (nom. inval.)]